MTVKTLRRGAVGGLMGALLAAGSASAASLAVTGPSQPVPDQALSIAALPVAESLVAGSAALVPLMAADPQSSGVNTLDTISAATAGGDLGKPIDDISFLAIATDRGRAELDAARDALAQLKDPELKRLAEGLVRDHGSLTERLVRIAEDKRWPAPAAPRPAAPPAGTAAADFDAIWTDETISAHERLAALYSAQAQGGEDRELRGFARDTLPTLRQHLAELRRLQK